MIAMSCKHCQKHLIAYIQRELPPAKRRTIARHLDTCATCYPIYREQLRMSSELTQFVPLVGQGKPPSFEKVWAATRLDTRAGRRFSSTTYSMRYGVVMLMITLMVLLPFAVGKHGSAFASPPTQPAPLLRLATPISTETHSPGLTVAFQQDGTPAPIRLQSTLTPLLPDAISTP